MVSHLPYLESELRKSNRSNGFWDKYSVVKKLIFDKILPDVTSSADAKDRSLLTKHGPDHIRAVINKASELIKKSSITLNPYENYVLLLSILVHDIGLALGRADHQNKTTTVLKKVFGELGFEDIESVVIKEIASAHTGSVNGNTDTIRFLERSKNWCGSSIRPRLLASLLRLADELSEDRHRANKVAIAFGTIPKEAEAYHFFSKALHDYVYDATACEIEMSIAARKDNFLRTLGKNTLETTLLNEVFNRAVKGFYEIRYCTRYTEGRIVVERLRVRIDIFDSDERIVKKISFCLEDTSQLGKITDETVYELSPELRDYEGRHVRLDDSLLKQMLSENDVAAGSVAS